MENSVIELALCLRRENEAAKAAGVRIKAFKLQVCEVNAMALYMARVGGNPEWRKHPHIDGIEIRTVPHG